LTTEREYFVDGNGVRLWTVQTGLGFPVMLCNGGPGCCDYLQPVAEMVDDMAHVIRFEERGCGRSESAQTYDIETCLADLENIRNHYNIDRWIIGGHSWGADLALLYALEHPARVAGLVCIAGGRIQNDRLWHEEYTRRKTEQGERSPEFIYAPNRDVNEQLNRAWNLYIQKPDLLLSISKLQTPALFVYGECDIRPGWTVKQVAQLMPNARFELIDGAEHVIWFSHENELRVLLREFVSQVTSGATRASHP
jgi:proline iminopeptidase